MRKPPGDAFGSIRHRHPIRTLPFDDEPPRRLPDPFEPSRVFDIPQPQQPIGDKMYNSRHDYDPRWDEPEEDEIDDNEPEYDEPDDYWDDKADDFVMTEAEKRGDL